MTTNNVVNNAPLEIGTQSYRLTLVSATPIPTTNQIAATTLYCTPYKGDGLWLYNGTIWQFVRPGELSITNGALSTSTVYDCFMDYNSGTPILILTAWTNATTRATALVYQNGVLVKSGTTTSRYLGTIYIDSSGAFNDTLTLRYIWNYYNRVSRPLVRQESTASWNYTTATYRQANASSANQLNFVIGVSEDQVSANVVSTAINTLANFGVGVGIDSTSANSATTCTTNAQVAGSSTLTATYNGYPGIGSHALMWLEISQAVGTTTWYGQTALGSCTAQSGIYSNIFC